MVFRKYNIIINYEKKKKAVFLGKRGQFVHLYTKAFAEFILIVDVSQSNGLFISVKDSMKNINFTFYMLYFIKISPIATSCCKKSIINCDFTQRYGEMHY